MQEYYMLSKLIKINDVILEAILWTFFVGTHNLNYNRAHSV